jgi:hypothetical protein
LASSFTGLFEEFRNWGAGQRLSVEIESVSASDPKHHPKAHRVAWCYRSSHPKHPFFAEIQLILTGHVGSLKGADAFRRRGLKHPLKEVDVALNAIEDSGR